MIVSAFERCFFWLISCKKTVQSSFLSIGKPLSYVRKKERGVMLVMPMAAAARHT